jgi:transposase-like protein
VKVAGHWRYLYRAIDTDGNLIDSMLSEHRDRHAARRFLRQLLDLTGRRPLRVTTDHHPAYRKAIRWIVGRRATHRRKQYLNNRLEQDHRGIKQRYYPMLGFGSFAAAASFCIAFDAVRAYFRSRRRANEQLPLADQRRLFAERWQALVAEMATA